MSCRFLKVICCTTINWWIMESHWTACMLRLLHLSFSMEQVTKSSEQYISAASQSPLPAWALSASLLYLGFNAHPPVDSKLGSSGGSSQFSKQLALTKPTRTSCFTFGAANALGGWMIFDGDTANGSGFTFAWSTLYLLVNGRPALRSLVSGRVSPAAVSILALGNAAIYGKQFFWPSSKLLPEN